MQHVPDPMRMRLNSGRNAIELLYQPMTLSRRALLKSLVAAGVGVVSGGAAYGYFYGRHALAVTHLSLPVSGLPHALAGLRIGLMTDVHRSQWVTDEDVRYAVDALMQSGPDVIALGGDYVTWGDRKYVGSAAEELSRLRAPHGVFAVLGNHDDDRDMPSALNNRGIEVLRDARTQLRIRNEPLELAGIRFWTKRAADIATVVRGATGTVILLAHDPRRVSEAVALNIPLVLSGHTHGGQVVLPVIGAVAARKFPLVSGSERRANTTLFVSRGVGTVYVPVRINCPPEVSIITLTAA
jgi:predicted MPP superfamily phosphohydrolase